MDGFKISENLKRLSLELQTLWGLRGDMRHDWMLTKWRHHIFWVQWTRHQGTPLLVTTFVLLSSLSTCRGIDWLKSTTRFDGAEFFTTIQVGAHSILLPGDIHWKTYTLATSNELLSVWEGIRCQWNVLTCLVLRVQFVEIVVWIVFVGWFDSWHLKLMRSWSHTLSCLKVELLVNFIRTIGHARTPLDNWIWDFAKAVSLLILSGLLAFRMWAPWTYGEIVRLLNFLGVRVYCGRSFNE